MPAMGAGLSLKSWREEVARRVLAIDYEPSTDAPFRADLRPILQRPLMTRMQLSPGVTWRDRRMANDGIDGYGLIIATAKRQYASHVGREAEFSRGAAVLLRVSEPGRLGSRGPIGYFSMLVDPRALHLRLRDADAALCRTIDARSPGLALLRAYVRFIDRNAVHIAEGAISSIEQHLADLLALAIGPTVESAMHAVKASAREAMRRTVLEYLAANADDPALSIRQIAAAHGLSVRRLHYVFEETGCSVGEHLLAARLDRAHEWLSSPERRHRRIADIALEAGFSDLSSFNRRYRARFGRTPSDTRKSKP